MIGGSGWGVSGPVHQPRTIGTIPDDSLLEIFGFYVEVAYESYSPVEFSGIENLEAWLTLVHVCRRWRSLVFASPRRLNLRLVCTRRKPVREMLDIWPTLPIVVDDQHRGRLRPPWMKLAGVDSVIAALEHQNRVCQISLECLPSSQFFIFTEMMQEPFLGLTSLYLDARVESPMLHPDSFLGGSAPRLRSLTLKCIPLPELPTLLLSTKDLVELRLCDIPHSGYISPRAMVTCLSSLTRLEILELRFVSRQSSPNRSGRHWSSSTCIDLPALTRFSFEGANEYIDLVARINAPLLRHIRITFFDRPLFEISQLSQFIDRLEIFKMPHRAVVDFDCLCTDAKFSLVEDTAYGSTVMFPVSCATLEWQLPLMTALFGSSSSPFWLSSSEGLDIRATDEDLDENTDVQWLKMLQPFTAVKELRIDTHAALHLARTLQELAGQRAAEVLPTLQDVFIREYHLLGAAQEAMRPFIAARQLSGHPVTVHRWDSWE